MQVEGTLTFAGSGFFRNAKKKKAAESHRMKERARGGDNRVGERQRERERERECKTEEKG